MRAEPLLCLCWSSFADKLCVCVWVWDYPTVVLSTLGRKGTSRWWARSNYIHAGVRVAYEECSWGVSWLVWQIFVVWFPLEACSRKFCECRPTFEWVETGSLLDYVLLKVALILRLNDIFLSAISSGLWRFRRLTIIFRPQGTARRTRVLPCVDTTTPVVLPYWVIVCCAQSRTLDSVV
jgi:hypothetical protein